MTRTEPVHPHPVHPHPVHPQGRSYYEDTALAPPPAPPLDGDARAEVVVVGGGLTGISTALHLAERGVETVLLEAGALGHGASGRNGGQVGTGFNWPQAKLESRLGAEWARALWDLSEEAKAMLRERIARHAIDCDLKHGVLHLAHRRRFLDEYRQGVAHLQEGYGYDRIRFVDAEEAAAMLGSTVYFGGSLDSGAMHLHPLNLLLGLAGAAAAAGARLHAGTPALALERGEDPGDTEVVVATARGRVRADRLVVACNGYRGGFAPRIGGRVLPIDNYVLTTAPLPADLAPAVLPADVAAADSRFAVNYFRRTADNRLLFGGGENAGGPAPADLKRFVQARMLPIFPQLRDHPVDHAWGGTLAITASRLPELGARHGRVFYAHGYSGHGVALAVLAGRLLAEALAGETRRWDRLAQLRHLPFPGGTLLRRPLLALALAWFRLLDRL